MDYKLYDPSGLPKLVLIPDIPRSASFLSIILMICLQSYLISLFALSYDNVGHGHIITSPLTSLAEDVVSTVALLLFALCGASMPGLLMVVKRAGTVS